MARPCSGQRPPPPRLSLPKAAPSDAWSASSSPISSGSRRSPRSATAEEVRDTLTRYFDLARDVIDRYGGTVEKFIGDAVMAVWGAPTAARG